jgi:OFA family oxalate/formate antiporter-like MFS transporter
MNRWLILLLGIIGNLALGVAYASSVLSKPMMENMLGIDPTQVKAYFSIIFTLSFLFLPVGMMLAGRLERISHRLPIALGAIIYGAGVFTSSYVTDFYVFCITFGFALSFGAGLAYGPIVASAVRWFPDKKGLASGLAVSALGFGPVWIAPLCALLLAKGFLVQQVLQILGAICFVAIGIAVLIPAAPQIRAANVRERNTKKNNDLAWTQILGTSKFWLLFVLLFLGTLPGMMIISAAKIIFQDIGKYTDVQAASLVAFLAAANALGRFGWGTVSDYIGRINALILMYIFAASAMIALTLPAASTPAMLVFIVFVVGVTFGGYLGLFPSFCAESFGLKNMAMNYAFLFCAFAAAAIVGPRIYVLFDPKSAFYVAFGLTLTGCVVALLYRQINRSTG